MPNYCDNQMSLVFKDEKSVEEFIKRHFKEDTFDFNTIVEEPKRKEDCPFNCLANKDSYIQEDKDRPWFDWYKWHLEYWGTKWNSWNAIYNVDKNTLNFSFTTAWSPSVPVTQKLIQMYPDVHIRHTWYESGCYFAGFVSSDNPKEVYDCQTDEEVREFSYEEGFEDRKYYFFGFINDSVPDSKEVIYPEKYITEKYTGNNKGVSIGNQAKQVAKAMYGEGSPVTIICYECDAEDIDVATIKDDCLDHWEI